MPIDGLNEVNSIHNEVQKIATDSLGKGFFGSRFKILASAVGIVIFVIAASIFLYYCLKSKKSDDGKKEDTTNNNETQTQNDSKDSPHVVTTTTIVTTNKEHDINETKKENEKEQSPSTTTPQTSTQSNKSETKLKVSASIQEKIDLLKLATNSNTKGSETPKTSPNQVPQNNPIRTVETVTFETLKLKEFTDEPPKAQPQSQDLNNSTDQNQTTINASSTSTEPVQKLNDAPTYIPEIPTELQQTPLTAPLDLSENNSLEYQIPDYNPDYPPKMSDQSIIITEQPNLTSPSTDRTSKSLPTPPLTRSNTNSSLSIELNAVIEKEEKDPLIECREIRKNTLKRSKAAYQDAKDMLKVLKNPKTASETIKSVPDQLKNAPEKFKNSLGSVFKKSKNEKTEEKLEEKAFDEEFSLLETQIQSLKTLIQDLKKDEIESLQQENRYISSLKGPIKIIELKIESIKNEQLNNLTLLNRSKFDILKERLKVEGQSQSNKTKESKVANWEDSANIRDEFFKELISTQTKLAKDLKKHLENKQGILSKFSEDHQFVLAFKRVYQASQKMADEFSKIKNVSAHYLKMKTVAEIFQSSDFQEYIESVKNYKPYLSNKSITDLYLTDKNSAQAEMDSRLIKLPITRLALYPLHIEVAITLTPKNDLLYPILNESLISIRKKLEFL